MALRFKEGDIAIAEVSPSEDWNTVLFNEDPLYGQLVTVIDVDDNDTDFPYVVQPTNNKNCNYSALQEHHLIGIEYS
jgi:hypothetical protein